MVNYKNSKKGVELALNTIVIAILIIIVLLVIILVFTNKIGDTSKTLNDNSATACSMNNPALKTMGYTNVFERTYNVDATNKGCDPNSDVISVIPISGKTGEPNRQICCGIK